QRNGVEEARRSPASRALRPQPSRYEVFEPGRAYIETTSNPAGPPYSDAEPDLYAMRRFCILLLAVMLLAGNASASMVVPVNVQMELFANIAKLDRNTDPAKGVTLAIVYQRGYPESVSAKESVIAAA